MSEKTITVDAVIDFLLENRTMDMGEALDEGYLKRGWTPPQEEFNPDKDIVQSEKGYIGFWRDNNYPYFLWGVVTGITEAGRIKTKSYGGYVFKPQFILPLDKGKQLIETLEKLKELKHKEMHEIKRSFNLLLASEFEQLGISLLPDNLDL